MNASGNQLVYCVDTSGWTGLHRAYPVSSFPTLWRRIDDVIQTKRLISPEEVFTELSPQDDEILGWVKKRRQLFKACDDEQLILAVDILRQYPRLVNSNKSGPQADPFVVALAIKTRRDLSILGTECVVVSGETPGGTKKTKIPEVCAGYTIRHFRVIDMICEESWVF